MHEQTTKGFGKMNICIVRFGIRIGDRKYLNEYTPFGSVSLWNVGVCQRQELVKIEQNSGQNRELINH